MALLEREDYFFYIVCFLFEDSHMSELQEQCFGMIKPRSTEQIELFETFGCI